MKRPRLWAFALILAGGCASIPRDMAKGVANRWAPASATVGRALIDRYGVPDDATLNELTWNRRGPWKRTVVRNRKPVYSSRSDLAVITQTVDYPLTLEQAAELLAFSEDLEIDLRRGELSSRSRNEGMNFLTLNLADEIVRGRKSVAQARADHERVARFAAAGKTSPYTQGLLFASDK